MDLIPLLSESLSGEALTAVFVCISQADNAPQSKFTMDFGKNFSRLTVTRKRVPLPRQKILREIEKDFACNKSYLKQANVQNVSSI